jgi:hypothetical protein
MAVLDSGATIGCNNNIRKEDKPLSEGDYASYRKEKTILGSKIILSSSESTPRIF